MKGSIVETVERDDEEANSKSEKLEKKKTEKYRIYWRKARVAAISRLFHISQTLFH